MSHTSGVSAWEQPVAVEDIYDWEKSTSMLAAQAPWWEPGTASGYHALNQGHLVGEVIRRITGTKLGEFFAQRGRRPLGADFHIGLAPSEFDRVANVVPPPPLPIDLAHARPRQRRWSRRSPAPRPTRRWRGRPSGARPTSARPTATATRARSRGCRAVISNGGEVDGVRLLSPGTIDQIFDVQADGVDLVLSVPMRFGIGYGLPSDDAARAAPIGGSASGAAGAARWSSTTSTTG